MYMAQIQEVTPDAADNSGPIFEAEPLQKVQNNDDKYNVFAIESEHLEQPEYVNDTYPVEQDEQNKIIDSLDMSYNREQVDKDDDDLAKERDLLAFLIEKLKCKIDDNKNVIALENKVKALDNIVYKTGQSVQTINVLNHNCKTSFVKPEFLKKAQRANPRLYDIGCYNDNLALMLAPDSDETIRLTQESRSKLSDLIRPFDYKNLNILYDLFIPQREKSSEQRYFSERTQMPMAMPISTREHKRTVNQSVATPLKRTVALESTNQKPRHTTKKLYEHVSKTCSWWYPKFTPSRYEWKPKSLIGNVNTNVSMPLGNASRTANIMESMTPRCSTMSNTPSSSNYFAAHRDKSIHRRLWVLKAHDGKSQAPKDGENLGKMKEKGDACIFVGYSTQSIAYRVFNKKTRVKAKTIHVNFDKLPQMVSDHDTSFELTTFLDSDHAACLDSRKSTSSGIQFLGGDKLVSWSSKKHDCTSMSLAEAEYVSLSACYAQVLWLRTYLTDYGFHFDNIPIFKHQCCNHVPAKLDSLPHTHTRALKVNHLASRVLILNFIKDLQSQIKNRILGRLFQVVTSYSSPKLMELTDKIEAGTTATTLTVKLLILNPGEYDLWLMRIEQYFLMTDYSHWEVIKNCNIVLKKIVGTLEHIYDPTSVEEKLDRKNEMKSRGTLLMALPNKDQLNFHSYHDAKFLMEAIEKRYGGNKKSKKVQRTLLKQQYENFTASTSGTFDQTFDRLQKLISQLEIQIEFIEQENINLKLLRSLPSEWKTHALIWRNKAEIETISLDDLYNNLNIYEPELTGSSSTSQNLKIWLLYPPTAQTAQAAQMK
nr:ribonuclease H-like domain-containing protein [Tanacetum cinerariifolium]